MTLEVRRRVVNLRYNNKMCLKDIKLHLENERIFVSKTSLCLLLRKYKQTGSVVDRPRPPSLAKKLQLRHLVMIDEALAEDDEMTNAELREMLREAGVMVSLSTIQRAKRHLG